MLAIGQTRVTKYPSLAEQAKHLEPLTDFGLLIDLSGDPAANRTGDWAVQAFLTDESPIICSHEHEPDSSPKTLAAPCSSAATEAT